MTDRKPRIGILGIMQDLYDDMIPGIAQRQEGYAAELAAHLAEVGEFIPSKPVKYREDAQRAMREPIHLERIMRDVDRLGRRVRPHGQCIAGTFRGSFTHG